MATVPLDGSDQYAGSTASSTLTSTDDGRSLVDQFQPYRNDSKNEVDSYTQHSEGSLRFIDLKPVEPVYESFVCPLTKQVMQDPVTLENGQTYERSAIERWFQECKDNGRPPVCPVTNTELNSTEFKSSLALRNIIEEWKGRNEGARIDNARILLGFNRTDEEMLSGLSDLHTLCLKNEVNKRKVRTAGMIPFIAERLKSGEEVRCAALTTLRVLAEDDDENKEAIGETDAIRSCFKCLSHKLSKEREEAICLLFELSKHYNLCEKIGAVNGAILMLVGMTCSKSENVLAVQKAEETLENLEKCDQNMKQMAENGRLQPLLRQLVTGSDELRLEMTRYLAEVVLSKEEKAFVALSAGKALVGMLDCGYLAGKEASLRSLSQLSTLRENGTVLVNAGVMPPVIRDLFSVGTVNQLPMKAKEISATILANIVNSGVDLRSVSVDPSGGTLMSEEIIHSLLHLISNTGPAIEGKLLQVLVGLAASTDAEDNLVSSILSAGATSSLIQFLEAPQKEIRLNAVKLLNLISPHMGQVLADGLRGTTGQLGALVKLLGISGVTEEQAAAAGLLAKLPNQDAHLTGALYKEQALPIVARRVNELNSGIVQIGGGRFVGDFKAGLVAILSRFTYALDNPEMIKLAKEYNLTSLFTDLLKAGEMDEVKRQSALALENLSSCSRHLSDVKDSRQGKEGCCIALLQTLRLSSEPPVKLCSIHGGICSARDTFCLIEAGAVVHLATNLDHKNVGVVEASLGALVTLLRETVDAEKAVQLFKNAGVIHIILEIMKEHKTDVLWQQSVWTVEKLLYSRDVAQVISLDPNLHSGLVEAFRHGNLSTKQTAESALKQLNKIPNFSVYSK